MRISRCGSAVFADPRATCLDFISYAQSTRLDLSGPCSKFTGGNHQPDATRPALETFGKNRLLLVGLLTIAVISVFVTKLAVAAGFLALVLSLAQSKESGRSMWVRAALLASFVCSTIGFYRFVINEAIPGVVAGGKAAVTKHAVAFLRTIVAAQDKAREAGTNDHDGDGIGSALRVEQLGGFAFSDTKLGALNMAPLALVESALSPTRSGTAVEQGGYYFMVCLPKSDGSWSAHANSGVDLELAETEYRVYGWPKSAGAGHAASTWYADARESILELSHNSAGQAPFVGTAQAPSCDAVDAGAHWTAWRDKTARDTLPGATLSSQRP